MHAVRFHSRTRGEPEGSPSGLPRGRVVRRVGCAAVIAVLLAACAHRGPPPLTDDFAVPSERRVFVALREAEARDEQRQAILAAFDESAPKLKVLGERSENLIEQWRELDRRSAHFLRQAEELAAEYAEVNRARMHTMAGFDARVAEALDVEQWEAWQEFWSRPAFGPRAGAVHESGGRPGRGRTRRDLRGVTRYETSFQLTGSPAWRSSPRSR